MARWNRFLRRGRRQNDAAREIESYIEIETERQRALGLPGAEAHAAAIRKLGNTARVHEEIYRMNTIGFFDSLFKDLVYGSRVLLKSPGYTAVGVLSLALGIGANCAMFSIVRAVLLRPLPYPSPEQLLRIGEPRESYSAVTIPELEFWRDNTTAFTSAGGYRDTTERILSVGGRQEPVRTLAITDGFFRTLSVPMTLGREFTQAETHPGTPAGIVLGNDLWRRAFGANPAMIGRTVTIDNASITVIGVAPPGFWFPGSADAYLPIRIIDSLDDKGANTMMIARVKGGVTPQALQSELAAVTKAFRESGKGPQDHKGLATIGMQQAIVGDVRLKLLILFGVVGALLLIACLNLASLLSARFSARRREIAVRLAMGSGIGRLLSQFLVENALLIAAGCGLGVFGAAILLRGIGALVPFKLPASEPIRVDGQGLAFAVAIAVATVLAFSLAPLISARRFSVYDALKSGGRASGAGAARQAGRSILIVTEVALSAMLLVSAALLIQTLYRLETQPLGFSADGVVTFSAPRERYRDAAAQHSFNSALLERLQSMPGMLAAAAVNMLPLTGHGNLPAERAGDPDHAIGGTEIREVTPGYFAAMRVPLARGRAFAAMDTAGAQPVAILNETAARIWWKKDNPIGGLVNVGRFQGRDLLGGAEPARQVIGVAADTKTQFLNLPDRPTIYIPLAQAAWAEGGLAWVVRADYTAGLGQRLRSAVAEIDSRQRIRQLREMREIVSATTRDSRFNAWLFAAFAALALALTAIGVYGLLAFSVARRTSEFGIRMALGSSRFQVLGMVLRQGALLVTTGLVAGLAAAYGLTRYLASLLYEVKPGDPLSFAAVAIVLLLVGLAASYLPARRATRVDPMVALRYE